MSRRPFPTTILLGAATIGAVAGWLLAGGYDHRHRRNLFSPRTHRRFAALGWLERHHTEFGIRVVNLSVSGDPTDAVADDPGATATKLEVLLGDDRARRSVLGRRAGERGKRRDDEGRSSNGNAAAVRF